MRNIGSRIRDRPQPRRRTLGVAMIAALVAASAIACESVTHENIDRWMNTQKGPGKLRDAVGNAELDVELRAHAAQILVRMDESEQVLELLTGVPAEQRELVLSRLVPRLWEDARVDGEMTVPSPIQVAAKDFLFDLRGLASGEVLRTIDGYLVEWLTGGYYAARARTGRVRGEHIMQAVGPEAAPAVVRLAKSLLVTSASQEGAQYKIEDALLLGLVATGSPEAVELLLDMQTVEHIDKDLPSRAMDALHTGFIDSRGLFEPVPPAALAPHVQRLVRLAQDESRGNRSVNDAIRLIAAAGPPACIAALVELLGYPHEAENYLWVSANAALRCGKAQALVPVADALPRHRDYAHDELEGALLEPILALDDRAAVAEKARTLLGSESWVSRVIGLELLDRLALADSAAADAGAIRGLVRDTTPLRGWWGDQSGVPGRQRKPVPRLGQRAEEVAKKLDQLSNDSQN